MPVGVDCNSMYELNYDWFKVNTGGVHNLTVAKARGRSKYIRMKKRRYSEIDCE